MNITRLLSSKERILLIRSVIYRENPSSVNAIAKELKISKALVSQYFSILRKEKIFDAENRVRMSLDTQNLRLFLNLASLNLKIFEDNRIISAGIYGSFVKGHNTENSDFDLWIYYEAASEEELAIINNRIKEVYSNAQILFLNKAKLESIKQKDRTFYHSLVFGSIVIRGEEIERL